MAWVLVVVAGFLEAGFAISLKASEGFSRLVPSILFLLFGGASFTLLSIGLKSLPIGPAYAVWTGLGALSTAVIGILFLGEGATPLKLVSLALVLAGVVGLQLSSGGH